mmetsp:Transcript_23255/g.57667  ORF Transcript_23255/g.57667 Transcript_23255/m.57667 type:complete len:200 (-) Transcript_23255:623-1222(-)
MMDDTLVYTSSYAPPRGCQDVYRCSEIIHSVAARTRCCRWNTCCAKTLRRQDTSAQLPPHLCAAYRALLGYLFPCCKATGRRAVRSLKGNDASVCGQQAPCLCFCRHLSFCRRLGPTPLCDEAELATNQSERVLHALPNLWFPSGYARHQRAVQQEEMCALARCVRRARSARARRGPRLSRQRLAKPLEECGNPNVSLE